MSVFTIVSHRDHPRVCGEQRAPLFKTESGLGSSPRVRGAGVLSATSVLEPGSSPRVRGAEPLLVPLDCAAGIIPACAGSSCWRAQC